MQVKFTIQGEPKGKGRPRFAKQGKYVRTYTPDDTVYYENLVKMEYIRQCKDFKFADDTQLDMRIMAYYSIPARTSKKRKKLMVDKILRPTKKPDWDNIGKIVADSLNGIAYRDDAQIVDSMVRKFYSENPRVEVKIIDILKKEKQ